MSVKYHPGDTVMKCVPVAQALDTEWKGKRCDYCVGLGDRLKKCGKCNCMYYCGKVCQVSDWKAGHKFECDLYVKAKNLSPIIADMRIVLRLYLLVKNTDIRTRKYSVFDGSQRCLDDLVSHKKQIKSKADAVFVFDHFANIIRDSIPDLDSEELMTWCCVNRINGMAIKTETERTLGTALYVEASAIDHSCEPNVDALYDGNQVEIRCLKSIKDGQQIYRSYNVDVASSKAKRRSHLLDRYFFVCMCELCISNESDKEEEDRLELDAIMKEVYVNSMEYKHEVAFHLGVKALQIMDRVYTQFRPVVTWWLLAVVEAGINARAYDRSDFRSALSKLEKCYKITAIKGGYIDKRVTEILKARDNKRLYDCK